VSTRLASPFPHRSQRLDFQPPPRFFSSFPSSTDLRRSKLGEPHSPHHLTLPPLYGSSRHLAPRHLRPPSSRPFRTSPTFLSLSPLPVPTIPNSRPLSISVRLLTCSLPQARAQYRTSSLTPISRPNPVPLCFTSQLLPLSRFPRRFLPRVLTTRVSYAALPPPRYPSYV